MKQKPALPEAAKGDLLEDLSALISINTSNPPGNELKAAEFVRERMVAAGAIGDIQEFSPGRANALCRIPFSVPEKGPRLIFNTHLDVVPSGEGQWNFPPFTPTVAERRIYGRGACDAKGSLAAMMAAARLTAGSGQHLRGEFILTAVAAEETGGLGTQAWLKSRSKDLQPSMAVVGEPTELQVLIGHKGVSRRKVWVQGRSAHSSNPSQGRNAIYPIARLALFIEDLNRGLAQKSHPMLGPPIVSANLIRGGVKDNVIPDHCELHIDRRLVPGEETDQIDRELREWVQRMSAEDPSFQATIEISGMDKKPTMISPEEPIVQALLECKYEVTGRKELPQGFIAATDMTFLVNQGRIPTVIFGPGSLDQTHGVDEFVEIDQLETAVLVYARLISRILGA
jgi:succinyl-diaminopimelate desuccinylase